MYREQRSIKPFFVVKEAREKKALEQTIALASGVPVPVGKKGKEKRKRNTVDNKQKRNVCVIDNI